MYLLPTRPYTPKNEQTPYALQQYRPFSLISLAHGESHMAFSREKSGFPDRNPYPGFPTDFRSQLLTLTILHKDPEAKATT